MKKVIYLLVLVFFLMNCKKKKEEVVDTPPEITTPTKIDTIKPSRYFPAFPGSYWKYVNSSGDTITHSTSATYEKDSYTDRELNGSVTKSATAYVPRYDNIPIWGDYAHSGPIYNYQTIAANSLIPIVPENFRIGGGWTTYAVGHSYICGSIEKKDTSIQIAGKNYYPTIVVYFRSYYTGPVGYVVTKKYYTKDIGLIKEEVLKNGDTTFLETHLVSYHINR